MMNDWLSRNIDTNKQCLLTTLCLLLYSQIGFAISPDRIVAIHDIIPIYNPAATIGTNEKCKLNLLSCLGTQSRSVSPQYNLFQGELPITTDYLNLGVGLDAEYHKNEASNFKQIHLQVAGISTLKFGTLSYGIAPGFYSLSLNGNGINTRRIRLSLNGGIMFENKIFNLGVSATQLFTGQNELGHIYGRMSLHAGMIEFIPSIMFSTDLSYSRTDILGQFKLWNKFSIGGGWSTSNFATATTRVDFDDFYIGYAILFQSKQVENKTFNHEIFMGYSFKFNLNEPTRYGSKSIRYM